MPAKSKAPATQCHFHYDAFWIGTFGNPEQPALSFVGGKNAGGYGCYWRVQCRPHMRHLICIHFYQWHQALWYLPGGGYSLCDGWYICAAVLTPFLPEALLAYGYCHCLRLCVCVCVCLSVCQLLLVRTITRRPFKLGSPNLDQKMQNILLKILIVLGAD